MNPKNYCLLSGVIFGVVALAHLCRLFLHWPITLGSWQAPMWISVPGLIVPGALSVWGLRLGLGKSHA